MHETGRNKTCAKQNSEIVFQQTMIIRFI